MLVAIENASCREAALFLNEIGLPVIPCRDRQPVDSDWDLRQYALSEIEQIFDDHSELNLGLVLGRGSQLIEVIEPTDGNGSPVNRDMYQLLDGHFPETPTFEAYCTYHRLFAWDERLAALSSPVLKVGSLTVLTGAGKLGAFSILPPSITDGVPREWRLLLDDYEGDVARLSDTVIGKILNAEYLSQASDTLSIGSFGCLYSRCSHSNEIVLV